MKIVFSQRNNKKRTFENQLLCQLLLKQIWKQNKKVEIGS